MSLAALSSLRERLSTDTALIAYMQSHYGKAAKHFIGYKNAPSANDFPSICYVPVSEQRKFNKDGAVTVSLVLGVHEPGISPPRRGLAPLFAYAEALAQVRSYAAGYGLATQTDPGRTAIVWQTANPHSWIFGGWLYPPPPPAPKYTPATDLIFYQPQPDFTGGAVLEFNRPCYAWPLFSKTTTHHQGATIVLHTLKVTRLPDLADIPAVSVSLQFDIDSWAWGATLQLAGEGAMALLEPVNGEPRKVRIELDGIYITCLIEQWGERRQFGETAYTASGRSPLALFAAPFAPLRSRLETGQRTAAQLIDYELDNTGWSAAYHPDLAQLMATDWLIPGGVWSYQNSAPIDAIDRIAKAIGARAYADRNADIVHIAARYPASPWAWAAATPDKELPLSLVVSMATQLTPQPDYNQVYVSGLAQGVVVSAIRQGTAGDKPAPMLTDSLITYANAGRERARNVLANTGRQARVTLELPLNDSTGLFEPGQLVEITGETPWRGLVTGISISAELGAISQTVEIERHY